MAVKTAEEYYKNEGKGRLEAAQNRLNNPAPINHDRVSQAKAEASSRHQASSGNHSYNTGGWSGSNSIGGNSKEKNGSTHKGKSGSRTIGEHRNSNGSNGNAKRGITSKSAKDQIGSFDMDVYRDKAIYAKEMAEISGWDDYDRNLLHYASMDFDPTGATYAADPITGENLAKKELEQKYGREKIRDLTETYKRFENARSIENYQRKAREDVENHGKFLTTAGAIPLNVVGGVSDALTYIGDMAENAIGKGGRYSTYDPNAGQSRAWSKGVYKASNDELNTGGIVGQIKSLFYNTAVNLGESAFRRAIDTAARGGGNVALGLAGTSAFADAMSDASERGVSRDKAPIYAELMAAAEVATEKLPFDRVTDLLQGAGKGGIKYLSKALGRLGISDLSGEEINLVLGLAFDALINGDKAQRKIDLNNLMHAGKTEREAKKEVNRNFWREAAMTAAQSVLSSLAMGGGADIISRLTGGARADAQQAVNDINAKRKNLEVAEIDAQIEDLKNAEMYSDDAGVSRKAAEDIRTLEKRKAEILAADQTQEVSPDVLEDAPAGTVQEENAIPNVETETVETAQEAPQGMAVDEAAMELVKDLDEKIAGDEEVESIFDDVASSVLSGRLQTNPGGKSVYVVNPSDVKVPASLGRSGVFYSGNKPVNFQYAVVPMESLVVSNDDAGNINPNYPQELQPRDRTRAESRIETAKMSRDLTPGRLADSHEVQTGAPIIRNDGVVIAGNGRTLAIRAAYNNYANESGGNYKNEISEYARALGVDMSNPPEHPVLVRIADQSYDPARLAVESNESAIGDYSSTETAMNDAAKMGPIIDYLTASEDGEITEANNMDFIQQFINNVVPASERNSVLVDGKLSQDGERRIQNAVLAFAYRDNALVKRITESTDNNAKRITNAMMATAAKQAKLQAAIESGEVKDFGLTRAVIDAANLYLDSKQSHQHVVDKANQMELAPDGTLTTRFNGLAVNIANFLETNGASGKKILDFYNALVNNNLTAQTESAQEMSLFSQNAPETQEDLYDRATEDYRSIHGSKAKLPGKENFSDYREYLGRGVEESGTNGLPRNEGLHAGNAEGVQVEKPVDPIQAAADELVGIPEQANNLVQDTVASQNAQESSEIAQENYDIAEENEDLPLNPPQATQQEEQNTQGPVPTENYNGKDGYYDLLSDDNAQRDRKGDVRQVEVPKYDADGKTVSESVGNIYGSKMTSDQFVDRIEKLTAEGKTSHEVLHNKDSLQKSADRIAKKGPYRAVQDIVKTAESGKTSAEDVSDAIVLYDYLNNEGTAEAQQLAEDTFVALTQMATSSGRAVQLFGVFRKSNLAGMFSKMAPDAQARVVERQIQQTVNRMMRRGSLKKGTEYTIDEQMLNDYKAAAKRAQTGTEEQRAQARQEMVETEKAIQLDVASQLDASFKAKWDAWRYMGMLGNVKTQARNLFGNAAFIPYVDAKNAVGAILEKAIPQEQRTKAVLNPTSENDRALLKWAKQDSKSEDVQGMLQGSAKAGDTRKGGDLEENVQVFKNKALDNVRKLSSDIPEKADLMFKKPRYASSLAGFLKARGYTAEQVQNGQVPENVLNEGRGYAAQEAMKATFNDANALSDYVASIGRTGDMNNPFVKLMNTLAEGVLPYRRTPANVVVRFAEYSPVGLIKGAWNMAKNVQSGKISASAAIDQVASGLTGTGAMVLGMMLANGVAGVKLTGSDVSDDDKRKGHQDYALEFSVGGQEYSYKIDWSAPANLPLFMGVNLQNMLSDGGDADPDIGSLTSALYSGLTMFEPMLSLSMLSSLNDILSAGRGMQDAPALLSTLTSAATSYLTQGIPTLFRQADQAFGSENVETNYIETKDPLLRGIQSQVANIPGIGRAAGLKTDALDEWGEPISKGSAGWRAANSFVNPGSTRQIKQEPVDDEIQRLNEAQANDVTPRKAKRSISYTDKDGIKQDRNLTQEEWTTLQQTQGRTAKRILESVVNNPVYRGMTDAQKAKVFDNVYAYAQQKGRTEAIADYPGMGAAWMKDLEEGKEASKIVSKALASDVSNAFQVATGAWAKGKEDTDALRDIYHQLEDMDRLSLRALGETGQGGYLRRAVAYGVDADTFIDLYKTFYTVGQDKDKEKGRMATEFAHAIDTKVKSGDLTGEQANILKSNMKFWSMVPASAATYDKLVAADIDIDDALEIDAAYREYENPSNADKMRAILSTDMDQEDRITAFKTTFPKPQEGKQSGSYRVDMALDRGWTLEDYANAYQGWLDAPSMKRVDKLAAMEQATGWNPQEVFWAYKLFKGYLAPK